MADRDAELVDYLDLLWRRKWPVVLGTLACVLVAGLLTWQWPKTYVVQATIDIGDVSESQVREVERLVARLNATRLADGESGPTAITANYRKPLMIELRAETRFPAQAAKGLEPVVARTVQDLERLVKPGREKDEARLAMLRRHMEVLHAERESVLATLRADVEQWVRETRRQLGTARAAVEQSRDERAALQRRIEALTRNLDAARAARSEAMRGTEGPARALMLASLAGEIMAKEDEQARLERELHVDLPAATRDRELRAQRLTEELAALEAVKAALARRRTSGGPDLGALRSAAGQAALRAQVDLRAIHYAAQRFEVELPERLRALAQEADTLDRQAADLRLPRVVTPPAVPRAPVRPRPALNLAVAFVAGLLGSVLLVFASEYVRAARASRQPSGGPPPPADGRASLPPR